MSRLLTLLEQLIAAARSYGEGERPMALTTSYRTRDGLADYRFSIECQADSTYRPFIVSQPSYGARSTSAHKTHRLTAGGRYYVCWNRPLQSEDEAKSVAALWADATQEYIKTGRRF